MYLKNMCAIFVLLSFYLFFFPNTAASATDPDETNLTLVAKNAAYLKTGDTLSYTGYLLKIRSIDNESVSAVIYKDLKLMDLIELYQGDERNFDGTVIKVHNIGNNTVLISFNRYEQARVWTYISQYVLKWGESIVVGNHSIKASAFKHDEAGFTVTRTGASEKTEFLAVNSSKIYDDLKIHVTGINDSGSVTFNTYLRPHPGINVSVYTDRSTYLPDDVIKGSIDVIATGGTWINMAGLKVTADNYSQVDPGEFAAASLDSRQFRFNITKFQPGSDLTIHVRAEARDYQDNVFFTESFKKVHILPEIVILRDVSSIDLDNHITSMMNLSVYNSGDKKENLSLYDYFNEHIESDIHEWNLTIGTKETVNVSYNITPHLPGQYEMKAIAEWNGTRAESPPVTLSVHGPVIVLHKNAIWIGKNITEVVIIVENTGDRGADVNVSDIIPDNTVILDGKTNLAQVIQGREKVSFKYSLDPNGIMILPSAKANYTDIRGSRSSAESNEVILEYPQYPQEPEPAVTAAKTVIRPLDVAEFMLYSYAILVSILAGIFLFVLILFKLIKKER